MWRTGNDIRDNWDMQLNGEWVDRAKKGLLILCFLALLGATIWSGMMISACSGKGDRFGAFFYFTVCMACGASMGLLFVVCCLRDFADGMLDTLMAPRRFRDRPAPLVTPVRALIREERHDEARKRLEALLEEYPDVPELRILMLDLLNGPLNRPDEAMRTAESYFIRPERVRSEDNAKLLLRYVGLARELGRENDAALLLAAELHRMKTGYTNAERKTLQTTLATLRAGQNG